MKKREKKDKMQDEAFYIDPKFKGIYKPSVLCVIAVYVPKGKIAEYALRSKQGYSRYKHDRLEALKFCLKCYECFNAGVDYDLVIIDNDSPDEEAQEFLENCGYKVFRRENRYYSYGAYKYAWDLFGDSYDYYLFHEQDWVPAKDGWLLELIERQLSNRYIGSVGNCIEQRGWTENPVTDGQRINNRFIEKISPHRKKQYNLDGEYFLIPSKILKQVDKKPGFLLFPCAPETNLSPAYNELAFHQPILELGYKLKAYSDGRHAFFHGICMKEPQVERPIKDITPMVPEQTRFFCPMMKEYFSKMCKTIVVLGMHRSGSSMIARILYNMGVNMGKNLMKPDGANPTGYYENWDFVHLNNEILAAGGGSWTTPPKNIDELVKKFASKAELVIKENQDIIWGWKDNRTTFTFEVYQPYLKNPYIIVCNREEKNVVNSLLRTHKGLVPPEKRNYEYFAQVYKAHYDKIKKIKQKFDYPILDVYFENFFTVPEMEISKIQSFLSIHKEIKDLDDILDKKHVHFL
ncbi:MAG TPA: glycosyltransferase [Candidatus Desulfofervidus auxilii]|uniref:Glycosyltransferase n=1 Tax=Desulfofervidus auxilii TaxID=1621989 RepID=A0A7C0U4B5_DESA2|nr:glycosyltransferase [Candidatus Desulfofervidus auxilii]